MDVALSPTCKQSGSYLTLSGTDKPMTPFVRHSLSVKRGRTFLLVSLALGLSRDAQAQESPNVTFETEPPPEQRPPDMVDRGSGGCEGSYPDELTGTAPSGQEFVAPRLPLENVETLSVALDPQGGRVIAGTFQGPVTVGRHVETRFANGAFVASLDRTGGIRWARWWSSGSEPSVPSVAVSGNGTVYVAGLAGSGVTDVEGLPIEGAVFIARWTRDGVVLGVSVSGTRFSAGAAAWDRLSLVVDAAGNLTLGGMLDGGASVIRIRNSSVTRHTVFTERPDATAVSADGSSAFAFLLPIQGDGVPRSRIVRFDAGGRQRSEVIVDGGRVSSLGVDSAMTTAVWPNHAGGPTTRAAAWSADGGRLWELAENDLSDAFVLPGAQSVLFMRRASRSVNFVRVSPRGRLEELVTFESLSGAYIANAVFARTGPRTLLAFATHTGVHPHCSRSPPPAWLSANVSALVR